MKQGEILDYTQQSKKGKLQIISFIRKQYNGADFRDIYTGLHKAILKDGKLTGVSTNLNMVYDQFNQLKTAKMEIKITTGTYNTSDYRVVKEYKSEKAALKFLKTIGYAYDELSNDTWNHFGTKYKLSIQR